MKRIELPEPAATLWRRTKGAIHEMTGAEPGRRFALGGGTILAARWRHRKSKDIDVFIDGPGGLRRWRRDERNDLAARLGGSWEQSGGDQLKVAFGTSALEVVVLSPKPANGTIRVKIDGEPTRTLSTTQILRGKLERIDAPAPVRDVYDFAMAARRDSEALANAVGMMKSEVIREASKYLKAQRGRIAGYAARHIAPIGADRIGNTELADAARAAMEDYRTTSLAFSCEGRSLKVRRRTGNGDSFEYEWKRGNAVAELEKNGLTAYLRNYGEISAQKLVRDWDVATAAGETKRWTTRDGGPRTTGRE